MAKADGIIESIPNSIKPAIDRFASEINSKI